MRKIVITFVSIILIASQAFAGGPWTQPKGKGYFKLSEWWVSFDQHYTDQGLLDPNVTTGIYNTSFYGEYGITDRFTAIAFAPLVSRNLMNTLVSETTGDVISKGEALNAFGDLDLSFKYGLTKPGSKFPVAASLTLGIPTGQVGKGTLANLQTGDGEFNQFLKLDAGTGFNLSDQVSNYFAVYFGINHRTQGYSEEFRFGVEYGLGFFNQKLWTIGRVYGIESFKNGASANEINSTSIYANNAEVTNLEFEAALYVHHRIGISGSVTHVLRGEIVAAAPAFSVGVFYDMSKPWPKKEAKGIKI